MSELEEKLNALMSNPQLMQQIASMAQSMGNHQEKQESREAETHTEAAPDPRLLQILSQAAGQSGVDQNQRTLLHALSPYLSPNRMQKLERAMRAAKLAGTASVFLNSGGLQMLSGR